MKGVISLNGSRRARRKRKHGPRGCYCYHCTGDVYAYKREKEALGGVERRLNVKEVVI